MNTRAIQLFELLHFEMACDCIMREITDKNRPVNDVLSNVRRQFGYEFARKAAHHISKKLRKQGR